MDQGTLLLSDLPAPLIGQTHQKVLVFEVSQDTQLRAGDALHIVMPVIGDMFGVQIVIIRGECQPSARPRRAIHADSARQVVPDGMDILDVPSDVVKFVKTIIFNGRNDSRDVERRECELAWAVNLIRKNPGISTVALLETRSLGCAGKEERANLVRVLRAKAEWLGIMWDEHDQKFVNAFTWEFIGVPPESTWPAPRRQAARRQRKTSNVAR